MYLAPAELDARSVNFEYEGEMTADVALNMKAMEAYPFCRLTGPANILVVPARHSASISVKLMQEMAGATVIGPILTGIDKSIQICSTASNARYIKYGCISVLQSWHPLNLRFYLLLNNIVYSVNCAEDPQSFFTVSSLLQDFR